MLPLSPRVTAVAPPEPATRNIAWLPLITASVVQTLRSHDWPCSNWAMNSWRYWIWNAESAIDPVLHDHRCRASVPVVCGCMIGVGRSAGAGLGGRGHAHSAH